MATTEQTHTQPSAHQFRSNSTDAEVCGSIEQVRLYGLITDDWFRTEVGGKGVYTLTLADGSVRTLGAKDAAVFLRGIISGYRVLHYHPELLPTAAAAAPQEVWAVETMHRDDHEADWSVARLFTTRKSADEYAALILSEGRLDTDVVSMPVLTKVPARVVNHSVRASVPVDRYQAGVESVMARAQVQQWAFDDVDAGTENVLDPLVVTATKHGQDYVVVLGKGTDPDAVRDAVRAEVTARLSAPTN